MIAGEYGGADISPFEVIFFKTSRAVSDAQIGAYAHWADGAQRRRHQYEEARSCATTE